MAISYFCFQEACKKYAGNLGSKVCKYLSYAVVDELFDYIDKVDKKIDPLILCRKVHLCAQDDKFNGLY